MLKITSDPINVEELLRQVSAEDRGAIVLFVGTVRNRTGDKKVKYLTYEAEKEFAENILSQIVEKSLRKWPGVKVAVVHRIGENLHPGEITLVIATSSAHREEAYAANRFLLEEIKKDLPVWKKEVFIDGSYHWSGWNN